jgi:hypothetical protein
MNEEAKVKLVEKQYVISESLAQAILDYLKTRPYQEVYNAIPALLGLKEVPMEQNCTESCGDLEISA